jgi:hypothetical protein
MMAEEIERAAKASAFARRSRHDQARDAEHYWEHLNAETQQVERRSVRAAIGALREPTEDMLFVGDSQVEDCAEADCSSCALHVWQQMIDKVTEQ